MNLYSEAAHIEFSREPIGKIYFLRFSYVITVITCLITGRRDIFSSDLVS